MGLAALSGPPGAQIGNEPKKARPKHIASSRYYLDGMVMHLLASTSLSAS